MNRQDGGAQRSSAALFLHADLGDWEAVRRELDVGVDVNSRDPDGNTVLLYAAELGDAEILKQLLNRGADVNAQDNQGNTALMVAVECGGDDVVSVLRAAVEAVDLNTSLPQALTLAGRRFEDLGKPDPQPVRSNRPRV